MAARITFARAFRPMIASPISISSICQRRAFRATPCALKASGPLPTFKPTSSKELDELLETIRNELFIPAHMLKTHKNLVYRKANRHILEEEPVTIEIAGNTIPLKPKTNSIPIKQRMFSKALDLMKPADADAIGQLTMGFHQAKNTLRPEYIEKMARKINDLGRPDLIMEFVRNAETLGIRYNVAAARESMRGLRIMRGTGKNKKLQIKTARCAIELYELLRNNKIKSDPDEGMRRDPPFIGGGLFLTAESLARWYHEDKKGDMLQFAKWLKMNWDKIKLLPVLTDGKKAHVLKASRNILDYTSIFDGMKLAYTLMQSQGGQMPLAEDHANISRWLYREAEMLEKQLQRWKLFVEKNKEAVGFDKDWEFPSIAQYDAIAKRLEDERIAKDEAAMRGQKEIVETEDEGLVATA
ncbi:hypothetical protein RUND412_003183 [Rhizina undulata]